MRHFSKPPLSIAQGNKVIAYLPLVWWLRGEIAGVNAGVKSSYGEETASSP